MEGESHETANTSLSHWSKMKKFAISLFLRVPIRHSLVTCLALVTVCALLLLTTVNVLASTITINDQAGVLDTGRVQADAAQVPDPMLIYTTKTFTGDQNALNTYTRELLPNQNTIAIGIDTVHRHLSIEAGTNVQLSDSQASDAVGAFKITYDDYDIGGDYTRATISAIDTIRDTYNPNVFPIIIALIIPIFLIGSFVYAKLKKIPITFEWGGFSGSGSHGGGGGGAGGAGGSF
jgi:hypothetical protein